ncbi:MAG: hypothetical protein Q4C75_02430 [Bergeyella zoohelcum]|nr:hypothetical protein [Bergeyella zoohelcum]
MNKIFLLAGVMISGLYNAQIGTRLPQAKIGGEDSKWTFGGYLGIGGAFGGNGYGGTSVYVSPRVGYKITDNFEGGLATNLTWQSSKYFSSTMLGVGPFANYYFNRSFYVSGLYQHYFVNQKNKTTSQKISNDEAALYLGAGYLQKLGSKAYMQIGGMYNVLYKENSSVFGGAFVPNVGIIYGL